MESATPCQQIRLDCEINILLASHTSYIGEYIIVFFRTPFRSQLKISSFKRLEPRVHSPEKTSCILEAKALQLVRHLLGRCQSTATRIMGNTEKHQNEITNQPDVVMPRVLVKIRIIR